MKLVLAWIILLAVAAITAGSCSINHASDQFECTKPADCAGFAGRTCTGGYCVLPGGVVDAPKGADGRVADGRVTDAAIDAGNVCPAQCTSCDIGSDTCKIDCAVTNCNAAVVCPPGWNCDVECTTTNSCRQGVTCTGDKACKINCSGAGSCRMLQCGSGKCDVACSGIQSCRGVACGQSCGCDVTCGLNAYCDTVTCTSFQCDTGRGCSSQISPSCDSCP